VSKEFQSALPEVVEAMKSLNAPVDDCLNESFISSLMAMIMPHFTSAIKNPNIDKTTGGGILKGVFKSMNTGVVSSKASESDEEPLYNEDDKEATYNDNEPVDLPVD
jgi:hypothetical protein